MRTAWLAEKGIMMTFADDFWVSWLRAGHGKLPRGRDLRQTGLSTPPPGTSNPHSNPTVPRSLDARRPHEWDDEHVASHEQMSRVCDGTATLATARCQRTDDTNGKLLIRIAANATDAAYTYTYTTQGIELACTPPPRRGVLGAKTRLIQNGCAVLHCAGQGVRGRTAGKQGGYAGEGGRRHHVQGR